ncbi:flagella biosynthesis regulatory protein FliT [Serratia rhizosphaerae]|uniref:flagella biosynthesis regulatory protein FliT n=1 Tax=unclassified Serratia (in: enterobacteria) TaxID=2647522 RepID=UPI000CF7481B|nr:MULTISPECIES: flagella biosynthesis regulatory protein FliT [unclassified Serratia (in: enterobacteria)]MBU3894339.1 flagella biosynthesis regulatory protein FliT [Serratia rubidaea]AVJ18168.1 flagella biosynthesis regulatory protein FliT [Serratia sp. MYb239]MCA4822822.1 flagella biosynthesis regulatory protein FliT [Serratia rubidaea]QNK34295.1 flagella biosynthesis regulatory protein FliT [Serratia sp. JUb9]QPT11806.1 flagella biosynthesis regulatory protein FliT [Serratia rubidaea]
MERQQQLLSVYQHIAGLSAQMLALAQNGDWDRLVELELTYVTAVEKTADFSDVMASSMALQELLRHKLQQILDNETQLRALLQQRLTELKSLIDRSTRQSAVNAAYGQFHDRALLLGEPQNP